MIYHVGHVADHIDSLVELDALLMLFLMEVDNIFTTSTVSLEWLIERNLQQLVSCTLANYV